MARCRDRQHCRPVVTSNRAVHIACRDVVKEIFLCIQLLRVWLRDVFCLIRRLPRLCRSTVRKGSAFPAQISMENEAAPQFGGGASFFLRETDPVRQSLTARGGKAAKLYR